MPFLIVLGAASDKGAVMSIGEFGRIASFFRPLAKDFPGSLNLQDDAAFLAQNPGDQYIISTDSLVEGVHVPPMPPPNLFAHKALRTNLSDLAAKGAAPVCYFLNLATPQSIDDAWVAAFADGLSAVQQEFNIHLAGGDSVSTTGPVVVSITVVGSTAEGMMIRRDGAKIGDVVYVSGWIGDGWLGLQQALSQPTRITIGDLSYPPIERYWCPRPRLNLGQSLRDHLHAAADISDGLVADLEKICLASNVAAEIDLARVPFSPAALAAMAQNFDIRTKFVTAGDDYELICTGPAGLEQQYPIHPIGQIIAAHNTETVIVRDGEQSISLNHKGWSH